MATLGNTTQTGSAGSSIKTDTVKAVRYYLSENGNFTSITARIRKFLTCNTRCYIYADNDGVPGAQVVRSGTVNYGGGFATVVGVHTVAPAVPLTIGWYWLVVCSNQTGTGCTLAYTATEGGTGYQVVTTTNMYTTGGDDPLSETRAVDDNTFEVFATYEPTGGGGTNHTKALSDSVSVVDTISKILTAGSNFIKARFKSRNNMMRQSDWDQMKKDFPDTSKHDKDQMRRDTEELL